MISLRMANSEPNVLLRCGINQKHPGWNRSDCWKLCDRLKAISGQKKIFTFSIIEYVELASFSRLNMTTDIPSDSLGTQLEALVRLEQEEKPEHPEHIFLDRHTYCFPVSIFGQVVARPGPRGLQAKASITELGSALPLDFAEDRNHRLFFVNNADEETPMFYLDTVKGASSLPISLLASDIAAVKVSCWCFENLRIAFTNNCVDVGAYLATIVLARAESRNVPPASFFR